MAALTTVTNATFDSAAALVPAAVGGPLTRVTDLESAAGKTSPNSMTQVECTTAKSATVYISYDELVDTNVAAKKTKEAHGLQAILNDVMDMVAAMDVLNDNGFDPWLAPDVDFMGILRMFMTNIIPVLDSMPLEAWHEVPLIRPLQAAFTEVFADPTNTVTNTTEEAAVSAWMWDWGDGEVSWEWEPDAHDYGSSGTYTTRLVCIGPGGISIASGAGNVVV
jgi:hypothetical protein